MTMRRLLLTSGIVAAAAGGVLAATGKLRLPSSHKVEAVETSSIDRGVLPIAVTVARAQVADFNETVLVTGSLVPREEILVGPEVEGLRIIEVLADEGDRVRKGQVLARLVSDTLEAQVAQNDAALARADAAIAQARSSIMSAEARLQEAQNAYERGKPLKNSGFLSDSGMDQRLAAARTAEAALASARDGLRVAEAEKSQLQAQRREIEWRRGRTDIVAPSDGIISRRVAKIGGYAMGAGEPMFRIIAKGEIELDAEVTETRLSQIREGQPVTVSVAGAKAVSGRVRLVSPEIDKATRLGRVRVLLGETRDLRIGAFARGTILTRKSRGLAVPASAVLYGGEQPSVQIVSNGVVRVRKVRVGLAENGLVEIAEGLNEGDLVVAKAGTFLRDGDAVRGLMLAPRRNGEAG